MRDFVRHVLNNLLTAVKREYVVAQARQLASDRGTKAAQAQNRHLPSRRHRSTLISLTR